MLVVGDEYAVVTAEELLAALGRPVAESLRCVLPWSYKTAQGRR
jgi:hypothetical protein